MRRIANGPTVLCIILAATISCLATGTAPAQEGNAVLEKLDKPIALDRGLRVGRDGGIRDGTAIKEALEGIGEKYTLKFHFDMRAFEAVHQAGVKAQPVRMPKCIGVGLRTVLRLLLDQADAHHVVIRDTVVIRPNGKEKVPADPPTPLMLRAQADMRVQLAKPVTLEKGIDPRTRLDDGIEFLSDRYGLSILVHPKYQQLCKHHVQLAPTVGAPLEAVLQTLMAQAEAHYEFWDGTLVILPGKK